MGVTRLVQVGCDPSGVRLTGEMVQEYAALLGGVAVHPNEVPRLAATGALDDALAEVEALATHPRIRVVGETGLDYYRTGPDGIPLQQNAFRWHIDLAKRTGRALQIHDRDAHDDVMRILDEEGAPPHTVLHCFSGDARMARVAVERGYLLSFAGTVTFKNATGLRDALAVTPVGEPARRDRRAVPHPHALPRRHQRVVPRPAHGAGDGRGPHRRRPHPVHRALGQLGAGLRLLESDRYGAACTRCRVCHIHHATVTKI